MENSLLVSIRATPRPPWIPIRATKRRQSSSRRGCSPPASIKASSPLPRCTACVIGRPSCSPTAKIGTMLVWCNRATAWPRAGIAVAAWRRDDLLDDLEGDVASERFLNRLIDDPIPPRPSSRTTRNSPRLKASDGTFGQATAGPPAEPLDHGHGRQQFADRLAYSG